MSPIRNRSNNSSVAIPNRPRSTSPNGRGTAKSFHVSTRSLDNPEHEQTIRLPQHMLLHSVSTKPTSVCHSICVYHGCMFRSLAKYRDSSVERSPSVREKLLQALWGMWLSSSN
jgi:hypothetical protein